MATKMKMYILFAVLALSVLGIQSCRQESYEQMEIRELASGERYDSLFLGLHMGMSSKAFFDHCFDLNRKRLAKQGIGGMVVEHTLPDLSPAVKMNFFPQFCENKICDMPTRFYYPNWAPWNRKSWSDSLQVKILPMLMEWYGGNKFIKLKDDTFGPVYAKVDGNRRIIVACENEHYVQVIYSDLTASREPEVEGEDIRQ